MRNERVRIIVEIALTIALAAVLNTLKVWRMPQGGTISLVMLPILILAVRRGPVVGVLVGALYGVVDFWVDPVPPVHWVQYAMDYPVAYAMLGFAGFASRTWRFAMVRNRVNFALWGVLLPAVAAGTALRYLAHVVSGAIFFAEYAPVGQSAWVYSALYNIYVPISAVACFAAAAVILPVLHRVLDAPLEAGEPE